MLKWQTIILYILNFSELVLEIGLYVLLINCIRLFSRYLSCILKKDQGNEHKIRSDIRLVRFFSVVIFFTMITATLL